MSVKPAVWVLAVLALLGVGEPAVQAQSVTASDSLAQFAPRDATSKARIDFTPWEAALRWFVLRMGPSLREGASRPEPLIGGRIVYGHVSPFRLEGNRVAFNYMTDDVRTALSDYRKVLEELPGKVDLTTLPRNEQLAYWINLHNVAVIEQIALAYPVSRPDKIRIGGANSPLDETPFISVAGVKLSPRDIRTRIVYPNWNDPKVLYGFWRGEIGGPSITREAITGDEVSAQLDDLAREFVNSLRGAQKMGDTLVVSQLYLEARPHFFPNWPADLRNHLRLYADEPVKAALAETSQEDARTWEADIADLSRGETEPSYSYIVSNDQVRDSVGIPGAILRLLEERETKLDRLRRDGESVGTVTVMPGNATEDSRDREVK